MAYRIAADATVVAHLGFILFVALGGFLAWRWRWVLVAHVAAVAWGVGIVLVGWGCPLTSLERWLRDRGGESVGEDGFVDRYLEGVLFPGSATPWLRAVAVVLIVVSWWQLRRPVSRPGAWRAPRPTVPDRSCTARRS